MRFEGAASTVAAIPRQQKKWALHRLAFDSKFPDGSEIVSITEQLASPSTLQKYGFYWQTLFTNPRGLLGSSESDTAIVKPSDAIVFSAFNLTLAVVLQDRVLFLIPELSPESVLAKVGVYVLFSLVYWLLAGFAFEKGRTAGWVAGLTAGSVSCVVATVVCSSALIVFVALDRLGIASEHIRLGDDVALGESGAFAAYIGGYLIDSISVYHMALAACGLIIGMPTIARIAKSRFLASAIFVVLFAILIIWSWAVAESTGNVSTRAVSTGVVNALR